MSDLIGKSLGRYQIIEQIGEGGMATVYKAHDTRLDVEVAVKVIRTEKLAPEILQRSLTRFEREAKNLARLNHPNIIRVTDYGEYEGKPYLVMPYFPGGSLKKRLGEPIPWQEAFQLILPIARALDYANRQNMIHRDVKPSNILMTADGEPMLTDFGIAKVLDLEETADLTGTGMGIGTPEYMAPEQWQGNTSTQSDLYSLGVVLYEMITGQKPFSANTPAALLLKQATEPLPRPSEVVRDLPDKVENILVRALAKEPKERFKDIGDFVSVLDDARKEGKPQFEFIARQQSQESIRKVSNRELIESQPIQTAAPTSTTEAVSINHASKQKNFSILYAAILVLGITIFIFFIINNFRNANFNYIPQDLTPTETQTILLSLTPTMPPTAIPTIELVSTHSPTELPVQTGEWSFVNDCSEYRSEFYYIEIKADGTYERISNTTTLRKYADPVVVFVEDNGTWSIIDNKIILLDPERGIRYEGILDGHKIIQGVMYRQLVTGEWSNFSRSNCLSAELKSN